MLLIIDAIRIIDDSNKDEFYVLPYNTRNGISNKGKMMPKSYVKNQLNNATSVNLKKAIIDIMEIFNKKSDVILQVFIE